MAREELLGMPVVGVSLIAAEAFAAFSLLKTGRTYGSGWCSFVSFHHLGRYAAAVLEMVIGHWSFVISLLLMTNDQ